jgi:hypothetical protein
VDTVVARRLPVKKNRGYARNDYSLHLVFLRSFIVSLVQEFKKLNSVRKYWAKLEILGIRRIAKNMVFHPRYAQCFSASTTFSCTYE